MREEPLVYINGRPFVVRDVANPFGNLEYTGASHSGPHTYALPLRRSNLCAKF